MSSSADNGMWKSTSKGTYSMIVWCLNTNICCSAILPLIFWRFVRWKVIIVSEIDWLKNAVLENKASVPYLIFVRLSCSCCTLRKSLEIKLSMRVKTGRDLDCSNMDFGSCFGFCTATSSSMSADFPSGCPQAYLISLVWLTKVCLPPGGGGEGSGGKKSLYLKKIWVIHTVVQVYASEILVWVFRVCRSLSKVNWAH